MLVEVFMPFTVLRRGVVWQVVSSAWRCGCDIRFLTLRLLNPFHRETYFAKDCAKPSCTEECPSALSTFVEEPSSPETQAELETSATKLSDLAPKTR